MNVATNSDLARARRAAGLTQEQLAKLLGVAASTVVRLEHGRLTLDARWANHLTLLFANLETSATKFQNTT